MRKPTWTPPSNKNILVWDATDVSQIVLETCYLFYCVRHPERFMNTPQRNLAEALRSKQNFTWKTLMTFITPGVWSQDKPLAPSGPPASECCQQKTGRDGGCPRGVPAGWVCWGGGGLVCTHRAPRAKRGCWDHAALAAAPELLLLQLGYKFCHFSLAEV